MVYKDYICNLTTNFRWVKGMDNIFITCSLVKWFDCLTTGMNKFLFLIEDYESISFLNIEVENK